MAQINPLAYWERHGSHIRRYLGTVIIDNEPGWLVVEYFNGTKWAYAPMHIARSTGEVTREVRNVDNHLSGPLLLGHLQEMRHGREHR